MKKHPYKISPTEFFKKGQYCNIFEELTEKQNQEVNNRIKEGDYNILHDKSDIAYSKLANQLVGCEEF